MAAPNVAGDHSLMSLPMCTRVQVSFAQQRGGRLAAFDKAVFASYGAGGSLCLGWPAADAGQSGTATFLHRSTLRGDRIIAGPDDLDESTLLWV